jgi:transmembrane sensor
MAADEKRLTYLLKLFTDNQATKEEIREMLILLRREGDNDELPSVEWERLWHNVYQSAVRPPAQVRKLKWLRVAAAAIILLIATGAYLFNRNSSGSTKTSMATLQPAKGQIQDVLPGGNKAILTLGNGQQIVLDNAQDGIVAQQGNADVVKLANGELAYKRSGEKVEEVIYNTLGTPRGGQYRLILPDGSKVWLNAVSTIRYPTAFTGSERKVEITGEAYFEVTTDARKPFIVVVAKDILRYNDLKIEVLGTHFNINAYSDEPIAKTTLLEGSVKVTRENQSVVIKPGEQTQLNNSGILKIIRNANVDEAVAWRNGLFEFQDTDLQSILRQVMRWYDVDVEYQGEIPDRYFTAIISREKTLTGVLEILKLSDIDYKLDGKKLVVTQ